MWTGVLRPPSLARRGERQRPLGKAGWEEVVGAREEGEGQAQATWVPPTPHRGKPAEGQGTYSRQLVEAGKELIEQLHKLLGAAG